MRVVREFLEFEADVCRQSVTEDTNNIDRLRGIKASFETRFGWWFEWRNHEVWSTWLASGFGGFSNPNQTKHHCTWFVASQSTNIYPNWLIMGILSSQKTVHTPGLIVDSPSTCGFQVWWTWRKWTPSFPDDVQLHALGMAQMSIQLVGVIRNAYWFTLCRSSLTISCSLKILKV